MTIDISIELLLEAGITPDEYVYLYLLSTKDSKTMETIVTNIPKFKETVSKSELVEKGLITENLQFTNRYKEIFMIDVNEAWKELLAMYPLKTPEGRRLHMNLASAKTKYVGIIRNNKNLHTTILRCLRTELDEKTATNGLRYLQGIDNWIARESWKNYENNSSGGGTTMNGFNDYYGKQL